MLIPENPLPFPECPYLLQSQLQSVTPRRTKRKMSRKKMAPNTPYTMAEVMEMETELSPSMENYLQLKNLILRSIGVRP